ncbi:MAG: DUF4115 domain-containing protein [Hellea sp.]|nr:DUF4115 domain-containing protein [Hellea sp.]
MTPACIATKLKIQQSFVQAIEALDRQALPPIGYVLGYVRSYAGFVGLDPKEAVEDFKTDSEVPENLGMRDRPHFVPKHQIRLPKGFFAASTVLSCAAVLAFWYSSKMSAQSSALNMFSEIRPASASTVMVPAVDPETMIIKATAPSWVEIKDENGKIIISRILITGESWEAHRDTNITLSARDAGAIEIYMGDKLVGSLGAKGSPVLDQSVPVIVSDITARNNSAAPASSLSALTSN